MSQYIYLHIPKTAGTSLVDLMVQRFADRFRQTDGGGLFWHRPYLGHFDCITGHIPFFMLALEDRPREILCVVRRPVDRVLSTINHFLSEADHPVHQILTRRLIGIPGLLEERPFAEELRNLQTRMLGTHGCEDRMQKARSGDFRAFQDLYANYLLPEVDAGHLERAKSNVARSMEIGIFEELDYSVTQVLGKIVPASPAIPHLRAPTRRAETPAELLEAIADANSLDLLLYDFARELFLERAARHIIARGELIDLPGAPNTFQGLHQLEQYEAEHLRWTNGHASLEIIAPAETAAIELGVRLWDQDGRLAHQNVKVAVNAVPLNPTKGEREFVYAAPCIPVRVGPVGSVKLTITSTTVTFSGDPRTLGVPIRSIAIKPAPR